MSLFFMLFMSSLQSCDPSYEAIIAKMDEASGIFYWVQFVSRVVLCICKFTVTLATNSVTRLGDF